METSGLAFIEVRSSNPFDLFEEWKKDASSVGYEENAMNLATVSKEGKVANRTVVVKEHDTNGIIFVTDLRGRKSKEIQENPQVAVTFLWKYKKDNKNIAQQVRVEGRALKIDDKKRQEIYDQELLYCKIRSHLCRQNEENEWEEYKKRHDQIFNDFLNKKTALPMPDYYGGFQIVPERMDFYYAYDTHIADRVVFTKHENNEWKYVHVAA